MLSNVYVLNLTYCKSITDISMLTGVNILKLFSCNNISREQIIDLGKKIPYLYY